MENQSHHPEYEGRDNKGRFLVGTCPNPGGKNGDRHKGFASWRVRVDALDKKYPTLADLTQFFTVTKYGIMPLPPLAQLNGYDAGIVWQKVLQVFGGGKLCIMAQEAFWDRYEGTPTQTIKHEGLATRLDQIPTNFADDEAAALAFADLLRTNGL